MRTDTETAEDVGDAAARAVPTLRELEAHHITRVMEIAGGSQRRAARLLGITRWSLARRIKKHGVARP